MHGSLLLSPVLFWTLAAGAAGVAARWGWWEIHAGRSTRRRRVLYRLAAGAAIVLVGGAATADELNRSYSYIPSFSALGGGISPDMVGARAPAPAVGPMRGVVEEVEIAGPSSGIPARRALVYLPPGYAWGGQRYPVVYLIHGTPGTPQDWIRGAFADRAADEILDKGLAGQMILVTPDANGGFARDSECVDRADGTNNAETYLARDVVAWTDANLRTIPDRRARAIGGLSTGAYCAVNLALRHQDVFSVVLSHSGTFSPVVSRLSGNLFGRDRARRRANDPNLYVGTTPITAPIWFYLDAGTQDLQSLTENRRFARMLRARGVPVDYHEWPAERHTWDAWRSNVVVSLSYASRHLMQETI